MIPKCEKAVRSAAEAIGREGLTNADLRAIDERLNATMKRLARRDPAEWMKLPQSERVSRAAEQAIEDIRAEAARKLANAQRQIMATAETEARVTRLRESFTDAPGHDGTRAESLKADFAQTDHYTKVLVIVLLLAPAAEKAPLNTRGTDALLLLILAPMVLLARAIARLMFPVGATVPVKFKIPSVVVFPKVMVFPTPMALAIPLGSMLVAVSVPCWMLSAVKLFESFESWGVAPTDSVIRALFVPLVSLTRPDIIKPWLVAVVMVRGAIMST
mgnify:CR=1 FL=1